MEKALRKICEDTKLTIAKVASNGIVKIISALFVAVELLPDYIKHILMHQGG